jgi:LPS-assembly lipoprotein
MTKVILKAIGFSARRKRARRGSVHPVHDRWRASLQQRRKLKCEKYIHFLLPWSVLLLSACGFHLRGLIHFPADFNQVAIINQSQHINQDLINALQIQLKTHDINVVENTNQAQYWLVLEQDLLQEQLTNVAASTAPRQFILTYNIQFQLIRAHTTPVVKLQHITVQRQVTINNNRILGSTFESQTIEHEMHQDAAMQILTRLSARMTS